MEKRNGRITFHKAGTGRGNKITLPMPWLRKMGISEEEREVIFTFDENEQKIIVEKK